MTSRWLPNNDCAGCSSTSDCALWDSCAILQASPSLLRTCAGNSGLTCKAASLHSAVAHPSMRIFVIGLLLIPAAFLAKTSHNLCQSNFLQWATQADSCTAYHLAGLLASACRPSSEAYPRNSKSTSAGNIMLPVTGASAFYMYVTDILACLVVCKVKGIVPATGRGLQLRYIQC